MAQLSADRLSLLYRVAQTFNSSLDLDDVLNRVMDEVIAATRAERGFLMLRDPDGRLAFRAARGIDQKTIEAPEFQISRGLAERVAQEGQPRLTSDAQSDAWLAGRASVAGLGLRSILCVPLQFKDTVIGVIYVDNRMQAGIFQPEDLDLLVTLSHQAAIAIENARLFRDAQDKLQNLRLLHQISADLTSTLDLERVLLACLQRVKDVLHVATSSILTVEGDELVFQFAIGETAAAVKPFRLKFGQGITGWVAQNKRGAFTNDVRNDPRHYSTVDTEIGFVTKSLLAAPLILNDRVIGVISATNKPNGFTASDLDLLSTIGGSAAIAIENARLYQVAVEKGRIERELQVARQVQSSLIPRETPQVPGWDFAALWQPAREVSGDFYDFIPVNPAKVQGPSQSLGVVIADVSDKGMGAALFMALTRSIIRASLLPARTPAEGITQANRLICSDAANGMFVTLCYTQLDPTSGKIVCVNAGHNPPLLCRAKQEQLIELERTGIALGIDEVHRFEQRQVKLEHGDLVLLYTDGVTEATDIQGQLFEEVRLRQIILENHSRAAAEIVAALQQALGGFIGSAPQFDDITVVVAKRL